jgi:uncharacterized damage-inducible protein DinB
MSQSNPLEILLAHDHWANHQILAACTSLTEDQFHQRFEMGPGSLHDTLTHIVTAIRIWNDRLAPRDMRPRLEGTRHTIPELATLLDEASAERAALAGALPLDHNITFARNNISRTLTRGAVLTHITTHGMHHRAQCLNMLRHLGVKPLPPSSVVEWTIATM